MKKLLDWLTRSVSRFFEVLQGFSQLPPRGWFELLGRAACSRWLMKCEASKSSSGYLYIDSVLQIKGERIQFLKRWGEEVNWKSQIEVNKLWNAMAGSNVQLRHSACPQQGDNSLETSTCNKVPVPGAGASDEAGLAVLQHKGWGSRTKLCVGEHAACSWQGSSTVILARKLSHPPQGSELPWRHHSSPLHTQMHPAGGAKLLVLFVLGKLVAPRCIGRGTLGLVSMEYMRPQLKCHGGEKVGQASGGDAAAAARAARHRAGPCLQEGGRVPAAEQESKWKTVTYRKLCEARLVSEGYRWAGDTNTGNRC